MATFQTFQKIFTSSFEFYGLPEWLLEVMPDNVNLQHSTARQSPHGWTFRRHNARSKFVCLNCSEAVGRLLKVKKNLYSWSSAFTTILFRARLDQSVSGQKVGRIQMKIFEQGCHTCSTYSAGILDDREIKKTFYRLYIWILHTFYDAKLIDDGEDEVQDSASSSHRGRISHDSSRCDACQAGWCKALSSNQISSKPQLAHAPEHFDSDQPTTGYFARF